MGKKNRGYVSPEMDVILLERGDEACTLSNWCVSKPDGAGLGDGYPIEKPCPPDETCFFDSSNWGGD